MIMAVASSGTFSSLKSSKLLRFAFALLTTLWKLLPISVSLCPVI